MTKNKYFFLQNTLLPDYDIKHNINLNISNDFHTCNIFKLCRVPQKNNLNNYKITFVNVNKDLLNKYFFKY